MDIIVVIIAAFVAAFACVRIVRREYPLSSGMLIERKDGMTFIGYQPTETPECIEPPQGGSVLEIAPPQISTGYTPLLDDDPNE